MKLGFDARSTTGWILMPLLALALLAVPGAGPLLAVGALLVGAWFIVTKRG